MRDREAINQLLGSLLLLLDGGMKRRRLGVGRMTGKRKQLLLISPLWQIGGGLEKPLPSNHYQEKKKKKRGEWSLWKKGGCPPLLLRQKDLGCIRLVCQLLEIVLFLLNHQ